VAAREGGRPGKGREEGEGIMAQYEAEAVAHLVDARVALDNLRALNGCDHYHDAMRAVTFAAHALGVSTMDLVAMAAGRRNGVAA